MLRSGQWIVFDSFRGVAMLLSALHMDPQETATSPWNGPHVEGETGADPPAGHNVCHCMWGPMSLLLVGENMWKWWKECWHARLLQKVCRLCNEKKCPWRNEERRAIQFQPIFDNIWQYTVDIRRPRLDLGETGEIWFAATTSRTLGSLIIFVRLLTLVSIGLIAWMSVGLAGPQLRVPVVPAGG